MIDLDKYTDLERMFRLFTMVPSGMPCIKRHLKASISRRGKAINDKSLGIDSDVPAADSATKGKGAAQAPQTLTLALQWVHDVLDLKDKFDKVWKDSFKSDREIEAALNEV
jgi:cullin 3